MALSFNIDHIIDYIFVYLYGWREYSWLDMRSCEHTVAAQNCIFMAGKRREGAK